MRSFGCSLQKKRYIHMGSDLDLVLSQQSAQSGIYLALLDPALDLGNTRPEIRNISPTSFIPTPAALRNKYTAAS